MPEMDGPSLNAAVLLAALADLDNHLEVIWRYLHGRADVKKLCHDLTLGHNLIRDTDNDSPIYVPDQSQPRNIHTWVDAELLNGTTLVCYVRLDYGSSGWRLQYDVKTSRSRYDEDTIGFPVVETGRLEEIASALRRAGDDLIEAVQTIDLQKL